MASEEDIFARGQEEFASTGPTLESFRQDSAYVEAAVVMAAGRGELTPRTQQIIGRIKEEAMNADEHPPQSGMSTIALGTLGRIGLLEDSNMLDLLTDK